MSLTKSSRYWINDFFASHWTLALLALGAWLSLPYVWWASRRAVPRESVHLEGEGSPFARLPFDENRLLMVKIDVRRLKEVIWDSSTSKTLAEFSVPPAYDTTKPNDGYPTYVIVPDGRILFAAVDKDGIQVREVSDGKDIARWPRDMSTCHNLRFSGDGAKLLADDRDGTMEVWDIASGKIQLTLHHTGLVVSLFSPDGRTILSHGRSGILIQDVESGKVRGVIKGYVSGQWAFSRGSGWMPMDSALAAVGRLALRAGSDIELWGLHEGRLIARYSHSGQVMGLSPDGNILAVGQWPARPPDMPLRMHWRLQQWIREQYEPARCSLQLIDTRTNRVLASFPGAEQGDFSADGKTLMTFDGRTRVLALWDLPPPTILPWPVPWALLAIATFLSFAWWRAMRDGREKVHGSPQLMESAQEVLCANLSNAHR